MDNEMIRCAIVQLLFIGALFAGISYGVGRVAWEVPLFLAAQSFLAITLLELVNYVEHYGITRKEISGKI